ncbi:uncharacterized protein LOC113465245, partial [Ceratina calcarata]|uniref:Uncharacterized protein LOC113465245 n=1 Tax=Ceratina calcarata TaxID=156304 RepID=A0AAJ7SDR0_9HYME
NAFDQKLAVAMLRIAEGLDCSEIVATNEMKNGDEEHGILAQSSYDLTGNTLMHVDSNLSMSSQIPRVQSVPTMDVTSVLGSQFVPDHNPQIIRDSPTHGSARDQLKHKRKHAIEKLM